MFTKDEKERLTQLNDLDVDPLIKSAATLLDNGRPTRLTIERLSFESNPYYYGSMNSIWIPKEHLVPSFIAKRISVQDSLVATIVRARSCHISSFGKPQKDRHSIGFKIEPVKGVLEHLNDKEKKKLETRIYETTKKLMTCGDTEGWDSHHLMTFAQFLYVQARSAVVLGCFATEILWKQNPYSNKREFHSFRPSDAGTMFRATPQKTAIESVREEARILLESMKNKKILPEKFVNDEYTWVQVIDGKAVQAFGPDEMLVHNCYPSNDFEFGGYPITPIDTAIADITTHMNILSWCKLVFQNGRAARGMLVIKSEDVDLGTLNMIRQNYMNSINSVTSAWRTPIIGVSKEEEIEWVSMDPSHRDGEFQILHDNNARAILGAFQISPDELPGYAHLSRGTNTQTLSESNSEYKLEAARDVGIRPLLNNFEDFLNRFIFPLLDADLCKTCRISLLGLDSLSPEQETQKLSAESEVYLTYNDIMRQIEKDPLPPEMGGDMPLNPKFQAVIQKWMTQGEILEKFFGKVGASKDPELAFYNDPGWLNWYSTRHMQQPAQAAQTDSVNLQNQGQAMQLDQMAAEQQQQLDPNIATVSEGVDQLSNAFAPKLSDQVAKSEKGVSPNNKKLLAQQHMLVKKVINEWEKDARQEIENIKNVLLKNKNK